MHLAGRGSGGNLPWGFSPVAGGMQILGFGDPALLGGGEGIIALMGLLESFHLICVAFSLLVRTELAAPLAFQRCAAPWHGSIWGKEWK